jgi:hypothetical protein
MLAHRLEIRAQKKVDFVPRAAQLGAVKTAQGATSNDCNFHATTKHTRQRFDNNKGVRRLE